MKNFKLLLASTAILSTGLAIGVMAENPTVSMRASINIVDGAELSVDQDMFFGSWLLDAVSYSDDTLSFSMNSNGKVTTSESVSKIQDSKYGIVSGAPCTLLSFPDSVDTLLPSDCGPHTVISGIHAGQIDTDDKMRCKVWADSLIVDDAGDCESAGLTGTFNVDFTVTALYE